MGGEVGDDVVAPDVTEAKEAEPAWAAVAAEAIERASAEMEKKGAKVRATQSFDLQLDGQGKVQVHIAKVDVSSMSDVVNRVMAAVRGGGIWPAASTAVAERVKPKTLMKVPRQPAKLLQLPLAPPMQLKMKPPLMTEKAAVAEPTKLRGLWLVCFLR